MIELNGDILQFSFPEVHPDAKLNIYLKRTFRVPDDGNDYPLPPSLGSFPVRHINDFHKRVPEAWLKRGGVMVPMYQAEAMWIKLWPTNYINMQGDYPFAVKVATGKINAISGGPWRKELSRDPQDYMVAPPQHYLDGYCVAQGLVRQFVAMPLGSGYSVEEQITGEAEFGGLQLLVCPMKREVFERRFPVKPPEEKKPGILFSFAVGAAQGGSVLEDIYEDPYDLDDWDAAHSSRCFVQIVNSMLWRSITGMNPPSIPLTAAEYARLNLPWFETYEKKSVALKGSRILKGLQSVFGMGREKGDVPFPENESVDADVVIRYRNGLRENQVREVEF